MANKCIKIILYNIKFEPQTNILDTRSLHHKGEVLMMVTKQVSEMVFNLTLVLQIAWEKYGAMNWGRGLQLNMHCKPR